MRFKTWHWIDIHAKMKESGYRYRCGGGSINLFPDCFISLHKEVVCVNVDSS